MIATASGPFYCKICKSDYKNLQNYKIHLQSKTHLTQEKNNPPYKIKDSTRNPLFPP